MIEVYMYFTYILCFLPHLGHNCVRLGVVDLKNRLCLQYLILGNYE